MVDAGHMDDDDDASCENGNLRVRLIGIVL